MISTHISSNTQSIPRKISFNSTTQSDGEPGPIPPKSTVSGGEDHDSLPDSFDAILATSKLPPPGPDYYVARRALWLTPRGGPYTPEPSTTRDRLEKILSSPGAVESDEIWRYGIEKLWKGLEDGGRLKKRLPMALIVKVIHAAWLRDQTWPIGAVAPEPDDVFLDNETTVADPIIPHFPPPGVEYSSGVTTPWMVMGRDNSKPDDDDSVFGMRDGL